MTKEDQTLEALVRIETKQDVILTFLYQLSSMMGIEASVASPWGSHPWSCPVCGGLVHFRVRAETGGVERSCRCGTGLVPGLTVEEIQEQLAKIEEQTRRKEYGTGEGYEEVRDEPEREPGETGGGDSGRQG